MTIYRSKRPQLAYAEYAFVSVRLSAPILIEK